MTRGVCALCLTLTDLRDSHIVPKFVNRWLKASSPTKQFRNSGNPNKAEQDGPHRPLLCGGCEARFSAWEQPFADKLFKPHLDKRETKFTYEGWLLRFATSLLWRVAILERENTGNLAPASVQLLNAWCERSRNFLLGTPSESGPHWTSHVLMVPALQDFLVKEGVDYPVSYTLRARAQAVFFATLNDGVRVGTTGFIYAKIPGFAFLACENDPGDLLPGTLLDEAGVLDAETQAVKDQVRTILAQFFREHCAQIETSRAKLSPKQLKLLTSKIEAEVERAKQGKASDPMLARLVDERIRAARRQGLSLGPQPVPQQPVVRPGGAPS